VQGTLFGGECPNKPAPVNSQLLSSTDLANLKTWLGGRDFSLTELYKANNSVCSGATWKKNVVGKNNLLIVSKTSYGKVLGAFASQPIDNFSTYHFIADTEAQIFSFSSSQAFKILSTQSSKAMEIWTQ
jgi:TLD